LEQFKALNTAVVGVSKDSLASHAKFRAKYGFTFPLLSDPELVALKGYGAWGEKKMAGKVSEGVIRSTVVIGPDGKVQQSYYKVKAKGHAAQVLADLET
jgi:peroxiredoxin Q/BCP